MQNGVMSY